MSLIILVLLSNVQGKSICDPSSSTLCTGFNVLRQAGSQHLGNKIYTLPEEANHKLDSHSTKFTGNWDLLVAQGEASNDFKNKTKRSLMLGLAPHIGDFFGSLVYPLLKSITNRKEDIKYNSQLVDKFLPRAYSNTMYGKAESFKQLQEKAHLNQNLTLKEWTR